MFYKSDYANNGASIPGMMEAIMTMFGSDNQTYFSKGSFMPQRHDGIQACGLERREIAEDHTYERREEKGYQDDPPVEDEWHV